MKFVKPSGGCWKVCGKMKQRGGNLRKEPEMAYKKPEIVAKSPAKQSFVAGCPTNSTAESCTKTKSGCEYRKCMIVTAH